MNIWCQMVKWILHIFLYRSYRYVISASWLNQYNIATKMYRLIMNYNLISNKVEIHSQKCFSTRVLPLVEYMFLVMWVKLYTSSELNLNAGLD